MKIKFSKMWKSSTSRRKQRKFIANAPLHIKSKFLSSHLSKELREKYGKRSITLRKGDKVKILRGNFKGKTGKIDRLDLKSTKVYILGIEIVKKDGTKTPKPVHSSSLIVTELNLDDKKRLKRVKGK